MNGWAIFGIVMASIVAYLLIGIVVAVVYERIGWGYRLRQELFGYDSWGDTVELPRHEKLNEYLALITFLWPIAFIVGIGMGAVASIAATLFYPVQAVGWCFLQLGRGAIRAFRYLAFENPWTNWKKRVDAS